MFFLQGEGLCFLHSCLRLISEALEATWAASPLTCCIRHCPSTTRFREPELLTDCRGEAEAEVLRFALQQR